VKEKKKKRGSKMRMKERRGIKDNCGENVRTKQ
jgi:hypothetical protein